MDRAKFQETAPAGESAAMKRTNPRTDFHSGRTATGSSGGGSVKTSRRSTYKRGYRGR